MYGNKVSDEADDGKGLDERLCTGLWSRRRRVGRRMVKKNGTVRFDR